MSFNSITLALLPTGWTAAKLGAAEQLAVYYKNRTGRYTITHYSGSIVCFLPLQNITTTHTQLIEAAAAVDLSNLLPADADPSLLAG
ncbi:hypothetical protein B0A49_00648 [Cryomyces minteri]|uniref:Uncharacterized protein n=1 Tax=Cryomyces minteri TaxID=331657 RepID=A0A4U0XZB0_9PEZI|nr:hypothetical protein B0A49_00648 [Cryomyces minteri]